MDFVDIDHMKILKHVSTRWLSLEKVVGRTLHQWDAMRSYFLSHKDVEKEGKVKKIAEYLGNPAVKLYFYFLAFILQPLNEFNVACQVCKHLFNSSKKVVKPNIFKSDSIFNKYSCIIFNSTGRCSKDWSSAWGDYKVTEEVLVEKCTHK